MVQNDEDFERHLSAALIGGLEKRPIVIVAHDPTWQTRFESERHRLLRVLKDEAIEIHHIGSTSVPGLSAKPIIDMAIEVQKPDDESSYIPLLAGAGYQLRVRAPGHRMLRTPRIDFHLHCWSERSELERHLLFRDWLRVDEPDRQRYENLKRQLAEQDWEDTNFYAQAK